ncbi:hypothetical protein HY256_03910, partial [Candidatus Sumerlaeota bacterium]|nr:hypothetical protein [Candidatus Sumerlaeota bacterium]
MDRLRNLREGPPEPVPPITGAPAGGEWLAVARLTQPRGLRGEIAGYRLSPDVLDFENLVAGREFRLRSVHVGERPPGRA